MNTTKRFAGLLIVLSVLCATAGAEKFYVSADGNDKTGDGSIKMPFKTITRAYHASQANNEPDIVLLRRGDVFDASIQKPCRRSRITVGRRIHPYDVLTIRPYGKGERPVWKTDKRWVLRLANVTLHIDGIDFRGGGVYPQGLDSTIRNCNFNTTPGSDISTWFSVGQGLLVENCVVRGQTNYRCDPNMGSGYDVDIAKSGWFMLDAEYHALPGVWLLCPDGRRLPGSKIKTPIYLQVDSNDSPRNETIKTPIYLQADPKNDPKGKTRGTWRKTIYLLSRHIGPALHFRVKRLDRLDPRQTVTLRRLSKFRFYRLGEPIAIELVVGSDHDATVQVVAVSKQHGKPISEQSVNVPAGKTVRKKLTFRFDQPGPVEIIVRQGGKDSHCEPVKVVVMDDTPLPKPKTYKPLGPGKLVCKIDCAAEPDMPDETYFDSGGVSVIDSPIGRYRQTATGGKAKGGYESHSDANANWFAYKLQVKHPGKLHRVVYRYPDDRYRTGLALLYERPRMTYQYDVGLCGGGIRKISNTIKERTVYFWPRGETVWFALHAWRASAPAALQSIEIYEHDEPLPPLPVGNSGRYFGYYHEEPRFSEWSHKPGSGIWGMKQTWDRMGSYLRHVGQNLLWYSGFAYSVDSYETNRLTNYTSNPWRMDMGYHSFRGMLLAGRRYGFSCVGEIVTASASYTQYLPKGTDIRDTRLIAWDGVPGNQGTAGDGFYNFLHPPTRKYIKQTIREIAEMYKDCPNFMGPSFRTMRMINASWFAFPNEHFGYGDVTVGLFEKETGLNVPGGDKNDLQRFKKRYDYLTGRAKNRWTAWRKKKVTEWLEELAETVRSVRPDMAVHINETAALYELFPGRGMDPSSWGHIKGLRFASHATYGQQYCMYPFPVSRTQNIRPQSISRSLFRRAQGGQKIVTCPNPYMEGGKILKLYPQKLRDQVEVAGGTSGAPESPFPYYLERIADFATAGPAWMIADGGLSYRGICAREKQIAARFLRSLPIADYQLSRINLEPAFLFEGANDNGRYAFMVNRQSYGVTVHLKIGNAKTLRQLDNQSDHAVRDGKLTIELKPFRMIAFALPKDAKIAGGSVDVPPGEIKRLTRMIKQARAIFDAADAKKVNALWKYKGRTVRGKERPEDVYAQAKVELQAAEKALAEQCYDTADRYVRGYLPHNSPNPRGFAMPMLYGAMNRWPEGMFNITAED